ncbi:hypothetical protein GOODEAATRI_005461 [Goodea atripinnis]|uniref:Fibronectin type-III domain-containing protein n=1 Tax=Goodea atripinnis TaxID=208336 RepID=A0ABV0P1Y1_9TELE
MWQCFIHFKHTILPDKPEPPASCPVASLISVSSLVLSWSGPCYDGGSAILGYVVEVRSQGRSESGEWKKLTVECASTSYQVSSGLQPEQEYCFRVKAYNAVGESEPSPLSAVVKMENTGWVGKFGMVFKLTHKDTGRVCAGKFYKGRRAKEREAARKEIELMNHLHHPKLVQCLGAYDHKPEMVMVMEFGESPFQGNSDAETLALVTAAQWEFDEDSFEDITEEAQNFISSLLNKDPRSLYRHMTKTFQQTLFSDLLT